MEWELSKENVQPLRQGRKVDVLNETLQVKEERPARSKIFDNQRRSMIEAIDTYEGDDPLHPWLQCIRWVKDAYPTGGYQSELLPLVEACTRTFQNDERYKSDKRYLRVWVVYADLCKEPREIYQFLEVHSIGQDYALFYEAYATYMEVCRKYIKANEIYELGLRRGAQPTTRLQGMYQSFLKRMMQRNELKEDQQDSYEPEKLRYFGDSKAIQTRASARNPSFGQGQPGRKIQQPQIQRPGMEIFVDDEFHSGAYPTPTAQPTGIRAPASTTWKSLGTQKEVKKENDQLPSRWTEAKVPRIGKVPKHVAAHPPIDIFVDDECEAAQARIKAKNASVSSTTLRQRVDGLGDQRRDQEALEKNPLLHFKAGEKPSTASLLRREPSGNTREQASYGPESGDATTTALFRPPQLVGSEIYLDREDKHESSFEEARLLRWKMPHQVLNQQAVSSPRSSAVKAKLIEKSLNMFHCSSVRHRREEQSPSSYLSDREPARSDRQPGTVNVLDAVIPSRKVGKHSRGRSHGSSSDESMASHMPSQSNSSSMSRVNSMTSMDDPPAFACTMPSSQFSVNGEETVAIKKYAEELIIHGADPNGAGADVGGHGGLIDPTINTKEALQDILSMFNRPLSCEKAPQRKPRASNPSRPLPLSGGGFEIFVDDLDDSPREVPRPQKNVVNRNRGFEIFHDENDPKQLSRKPGKVLNVFVDEDAPPPRTTKPALKKKPLEVFQDDDILPRKPSNGGFEIFDDEDAPPPRTTKPALKKKPLEDFQDEGILLNKQSKGGFEIFQDQDMLPKKPSKGSFEVFQDEEIVPTKPGKGSFEVFVDEDVETHPGRNGVRRKPAPASARGSFDVFVNDDTDSFMSSKGSTSGVAKSTFQVYADDDKGMPAPRSAPRQLPKSNPGSKPPSSGFSVFVDDEVASHPIPKPRLAPSTTRR